MQEQTPPSSREAEESLLCCLLLGSKYINEAVGVIRPEAFYYPDNQKVMQAITNVYNAKKPVDIITVTTEMRRLGEPNTIGVRLAELSSVVQTDLNVETYAQTVIEKFILRSAIEQSIGIEQLKMKAALGGGSSSGPAATADVPFDVNGVKLVTRRVEGLEKAALRGISDSLRDRLGSGVVVVASESDGKVALVIAVTKDLTSRVQAGRLVKELAPIVGGGGGGRPDFAEAGGKDPSKIDQLLAEAPNALRAMLG